MSGSYYSLERREMLDFIPSQCKNILEIGCGTAGFARILRKRNHAHVTGIEMSPEAAEEAARHIDKVIVGDANENIEAIDLFEFDLIVCNDVLEHLIDPWKFMALLKRKAKFGTILVGSIPNFRYWRNIYEIVVRKEFRYRDFGILDKTHLRFFTRKSIVDLFEKCGIELLKIRGINKGNNFKSKVGCVLLDAIFQSDMKYKQFAFTARTIGMAE